MALSVVVLGLLAAAAIAVGQPRGASAAVGARVVTTKARVTVRTVPRTTKKPMARWVLPNSTGTYAKSLGRYVSDLETFWRREFLLSDGAALAGPLRFTAFRPGMSSRTCGRLRFDWSDLRGNAIYCASTDTNVFDDEELFP